MVNKGRTTYWTKEKCFKVALECKTKREFELKYSGAYRACIRNKWFIEACSHMIMLKKNNHYWTKEKCYEEALKYKTRTTFSINSRGAYKSAHLNGWLDEICGHMEIKGSKYKRYNYIYEFSDNHVYIGLTYDINMRHNNHLTNYKSPVFKHIQKTSLIPKLIYDELKNVEDSQLKESNLIIEYKENGWLLLNKAKAGGLGSTNRKWFKENSIEEALKYRSRLEFQKKCHSAYKFCLKHKLLDLACSHMIKNDIIKVNSKYIKWNKTMCQNEALKYKTKKEFYTNSQNAYRFSSRHNFLDEICLHMIKIKKRLIKPL